MSALAEEDPAATAGPEHVNEVRLVGRLGADPAHKQLPSGDSVWTFRISVERPRPGRRAGQRPGQRRTDSLDCAVWSGRVKRSVSTWAKGDVVEVSGSIRKRFFQAGGATASRVEVEVSRGRIIRRAASG